MRTRSVISVLQAVALVAGCRSTTAGEGAQSGGSGGADPVVTTEQCARTDPSDQRCARGGESCGGYVSCNHSGGPDDPPPRCGMHRWSCHCTDSPQYSRNAQPGGGLRWDCRVERHPAGPLPPPELAEA